MPQELNDLPQDVCKRLRTLSEIAFDGMKQQKLVFYKHELPEGFQHMGFMNECRELYVDRCVESSYSFLHLSMQEYLAALHISQLTDIEQKDFFLNDNRQCNMSVVMRFLAGITGFRSTVWQDILQHETDEQGVSRLMCTCLYETQNHMLCQQLLSSSVIKIGPLHNTSVDFYALGYCVAHSRGAWKIYSIFKDVAEAQPLGCRVILHPMVHCR